MLKQDFIDTFRAKYTNRREITWSNGKDNTRINQIWVSSILSYGLDDAIIKDMDLDTGSDYKLVVARLILDHMQIKDSLSQVKRKKEKRTIFEYDNATKENWDSYRNKLYLLLKRRVNKALWNNVTQNATKDKEKEIDINREWDNISRSIKQAAEEEIPRKKITNSGINKAPKKRYTELQNVINTIRKIVKSCKKKKGLYRTEEEQLEIEKELEKINRSTKTNIEIERRLWSEQLQEELTRWWKIIKEKLVAENSNAIRLEINEHVNRRCEMIKNNQSRMINSLLEKPFKKIRSEERRVGKE